MSSTIGFYGGVGSVTGANFMLDTGKLAVLVDCGLEQGDKFAKEINAKPFAYDPSKIDALFVTHAHADHIGRIPKLVKDGFRGVIHSTEPTKDLAAIVLPQPAGPVIKMFLPLTAERIRYFHFNSFIIKPCGFRE